METLKCSPNSSGPVNNASFHPDNVNLHCMRRRLNDANLQFSIMLRIKLATNNDCAPSCATSPPDRRHKTPTKSSPTICSIMHYKEQRRTNGRRTKVILIFELNVSDPRNRERKI